MVKTNLAHRINAIQNTAEVIAQSLKEMIYEAELKPGQPLIQERIAEMFQVSRVPVRDALQLLIANGIAVNVPRRGVIVRPLSRRLLAELSRCVRFSRGPPPAWRSGTGPRNIGGGWRAWSRSRPNA